MASAAKLLEPPHAAPEAATGPARITPARRAEGEGIKYFGRTSEEYDRDGDKHLAELREKLTAQKGAEIAEKGVKEMRAMFAAMKRTFETGRGK